MFLLGLAGPMGKRAPAGRDPILVPRSGHVEHTNGQVQGASRAGHREDQGGEAPQPSSTSWCDTDRWYLRPGWRQPAIGTDGSNHRDVAVACRIKNNA